MKEKPVVELYRVELVATSKGVNIRVSDSESEHTVSDVGQDVARVFALSAIDRAFCLSDLHQGAGE
jgi:hypothetical protein